MVTEKLMNQILPLLYSIKDSEEKLRHLLDFLLKETLAEPDDAIVVPEKYRLLVKNIAESLGAGMLCFVNPDTCEMEDVPNDIADREEYEAVTGQAWDLSFKHDDWTRCITISPPSSHTSFQIMEEFADLVDDPKIQGQIVNALNHRKPFASFRNVLGNTKHLDKWYSFRQKKLEEFVWSELQTKLNV